MKTVLVPWGDRTKVGTIRDGLELGMRIEMINVANGQRHIEQRWYEPSRAKALCRPSNGYGEHMAEWIEAIERSRR